MSFQAGNEISLIWKKLKKGEYTVRPFSVYKNWELTTDSGSLYYFGNYNISVMRALYPQNNLYFGAVANISSSLYTRVLPSQTIDPKLLWYYLDHNFFTNHDKDKQPTVITDYGRNTFLAESSSLMMIPQPTFGESIKRGSFSVSNISATASKNYSVQDDGNGNLYDASMTTTDLIGDTSLALYVGFNEKYREYGMTNKPTNYVKDMSQFERDVIVHNPKLIAYEAGIDTTDTSESTGTAANFYGSYLQVQNPSAFNFHKASNFAFSFWIKAPLSQSLSSNDYVPLFNKNTVISKDKLDLQNRSVTSSYQIMTASKYPFDISVTGEDHASPGTIRFRQSSGITTVSLESSTQLSGGSWQHVLCQKTGSTYQIWIDGVLDNSTTVDMEGSPQNDFEMYIASDGTTGSMFTGSLDEIRVYGTYLTSAQISAMASNDFATGYAYQTNRIGNIFYRHGVVLVSDPRPKYHNAFLGETGAGDYNQLTDGFTGSFRGTTTFYEHEVICKLRKSEYNFTQNWTVRKDKDENAKFVEDYTTGSFFNPYVTTIGLYNDNYDLIAIAKLASPLEKRDDVDINIIIRFDV